MDRVKVGKTARRDVVIHLSFENDAVVFFGSSVKCTSRDPVATAKGVDQVQTREMIKDENAGKSRYRKTH